MAMDAGVAEKVIVHSKEAGFVLDRSGAFSEISSINIPKERIKGSVGAGDAFCAGALYSIYNHYGDKQLLEFASAVAASSLFAENAVDGVMHKSEVVKLENIFGRL